MIIIKVESEGGPWEYHEFPTEQSAAIFLYKNPHLKLRLAANISEQLNIDLKRRKEEIIKKKQG